MPKSLLVVGFLALSLPSLARAAAPALVVNQSGQTVEHVCAAGERVAINGSKNTVSLTGTCANVAVNGADNHVTAASVEKLAVTGSANTVAVDAAQKIAVIGSQNTVTWKRGLGDEKAPTVADLGTGNSVTHAD